MSNASFSGLKGVPAKPDSLPPSTKSAIMKGIPVRTAMSITLGKGGNAMPKVK